MLAGDFELVDSEHEHESNAAANEQPKPLNSDAESGDSPVIIENAAEDAKDVAATQQPAMEECTPAAVDVDPPSAVDTPLVQPQQPLKKSGSSSKSARSIAKIAEPSPIQEPSTGLLSKTSELVSQAISSSEKVSLFHSPPETLCWNI